MSSSPLLCLLGISALLAASSPARAEQQARATPEQRRSAPQYSGVLIRGVPHVQQRPDFCGEACAEMALRGLGHAISQDDVFALTGVDPAKGRGAYTADLKRGLERVGFLVGPVWTTIHPVRARQELDAQFKALHADLKAGVPSIVCTRFDERPNTTEHFRLVVGFDPARDEVLYHEPARPRGKYLRMKRKRLLSLWPLKYQRSRWTVVRLRLQPGTIRRPTPFRGSRFSKADYAQHVMQLKKRVPRGFTIHIQPPFVVIGDEPPKMVLRRARSTVKWAVDRLKSSFFPHDPQRILDIWLFKDRRSYVRNTLRLFGERPTTPYGFYTDTHGALVMNIATGGGTLVHEIVHPFMEANFPNCPPWFNEGLGSLYEQSGKCDQGICGFTNWRLAGLQRAIRGRLVPSFRWLTSRTTNQFYNADPGTNYSQSRYLLYFLQQHKLLRQYYKQFHRNRLQDPTGYETLKKVLNTRDMAAFQRKWQQWVLTLRFR